MTLKILFFGDVIGRLGRLGITAKLPEYKKKYNPDIIIANAENLAHGFGITERSIDEMREAGVDFFTGGNHIWAKKEGFEILARENPIVLRPYNYPKMNVGVGYKILSVNNNKLLVVNLMGRVYMKENLDCPFLAMDEILAQTQHENITAIFVDFHAEVTSEKVAFFRYLDGRVSAVVGTHTHVPTADLEISEQGTATITDVGMNGPKNSVIGHKTKQIIQRFITQLQTAHEVEEEGECLISGVFLEINPKTGKTVKAKQILDTVMP